MNYDSFQCCGLNYKDFDDFYIKRLSYSASNSEFTEDEILWALKEVSYKYFGVYEMVDAQKAAVQILVWCAEERFK